MKQAVFLTVTYSMAECGPSLPKYWCGTSVVAIYFQKTASLNVDDPEKVTREKASCSDVCGNMTPSVHLREVSVLVGAKQKQTYTHESK